MVSLLLGIGFLVVLAIFTYRQLLQLRRQVGVRWAELEELLRQRGDMIAELLPQLRKCGKSGQMGADSIAMARSVAATRQTSVFDQTRCEKIIGEALRTTIVAAEASSVFRATPEYRSWRERLETAEAAIETGGIAYNHAVVALNRSLALFPISIVGSILGFEPAQALNLDAAMATTHPVSAPEPRPVAVWQGQPKPPGPAPSAHGVTISPPAKEGMKGVV